MKNTKQIFDEEARQTFDMLQKCEHSSLLYEPWVMYADKLERAVICRHCKLYITQFADPELTTELCGD